jgi:thiol:disulfide interchange protein DsbD
VKVDGTDETPEFQALTAKYGIVGMPTVIFIDAQGREVPVRITGAIGADEMLRWIGAAEKACTPPVVACVSRW